MKNTDLRELTFLLDCLQSETKGTSKEYKEINQVKEYIEKVINSNQERDKIYSLER